MITFFLLFTLVSFMGCREDKVTITKEYVINPSWDKISNSFTITKMKIKDSGESLELNNVSSQQLLWKLVEDTSFSFTSNVKFNGEGYVKRKVYFNKYNGFVWRKPPDIDPSRNITFETIGDLKQNTWYFLGGLGKEKTLHYIYLDSADSLHIYRVDASAWTNY